jgi:arginase family enzyme
VTPWTCRPSRWPANPWRAPDGLSAEQVAQAIRLIRERFAVGAAALTAYDPDYDADGATQRAGIELADAAVGRTAGAQSRRSS